MSSAALVTCTCSSFLWVIMQKDWSKWLLCKLLWVIENCKQALSMQVFTSCSHPFELVQHPPHAAPTGCHLFPKTNKELISEAPPCQLPQRRDPYTLCPLDWEFKCRRGLCWKIELHFLKTCSTLGHESPLEYVPLNISTVPIYFVHVRVSLHRCLMLSRSASVPASPCAWWQETT